MNIEITKCESTKICYPLLANESFINRCNLVSTSKPCCIIHSRKCYPAEFARRLEWFVCYSCYFLNATYILEILKTNLYNYLIFMEIPYVFSQIYPLFGPKQGGTLLTIDGINLGKSYEDIVSNISIAGVQCSPIRKKYVEFKQWVQCLPCLSSLNHCVIFHLWQ